MRLQPGEYAPRTATYNIIDENGKKCGTVSVERGQKMPPTHSSNHYYELDD